MCIEYKLLLQTITDCVHLFLVKMCFMHNITPIVPKFKKRVIYDTWYCIPNINTDNVGKSDCWQNILNMKAKIIIVCDMLTYDHCF
jgi:hypothetical protein